jgi:hypothetical protein
MQQSAQVLPVRAGRVPWAVHALSTISVLYLHFGVLRCTVVWHRKMVQYIRLQQAFLSGGSEMMIISVLSSLIYWDNPFCYQDDLDVDLDQVKLQFQNKKHSSRTTGN